MDPIDEDPKNDYKWGIFYVNDKDPRVFVPKRYGFGWTLNFSRSWSYVILISILALAVGDYLYFHHSDAH
jgi:uncharacterized membrane protein